MATIFDSPLIHTSASLKAIILSLDISAAFEMLDHTRLLNRATEVLGLNDQVINWLKSYLTNHSSYVSLGSCHSTTVGCTGVIYEGGPDPTTFRVPNNVLLLCVCMTQLELELL